MNLSLSINLNKKENNKFVCDFIQYFKFEVQCVLLVKLISTFNYSLFQIIFKSNASAGYNS